MMVDSGRRLRRARVTYVRGVIRVDVASYVWRMGDGGRQWEDEKSMYVVKGVIHVVCVEGDG